MDTQVYIHFDGKMVSYQYLELYANIILSFIKCQKELLLYIK